MDLAPTYRLPLCDAAAYAESQRMIKQVQEGLEKNLEGLVMIQLGELQVTPRVVAASTPEVILKYVAHHQCGTDLTDEEKDMRVVTRELHSGRYMSKWPTLPIVIANEEGWRFWNKAYENTILAIITTADESVTVVCMEDEVPKAGHPGPGAGEAPELTPETNEKIISLAQEGLL